MNASGVAALGIGEESSCASFFAGREGKMAALLPHIAHSRIPPVRRILTYLFFLQNISMIRPLFHNSNQCPTNFVQREQLSLQYFSNITYGKCQQERSRKQRIDLKHWRQLMKKMYWAAVAVNVN